MRDNRPEYPPEWDEPDELPEIELDLEDPQDEPTDDEIEAALNDYERMLQER